MITPKIVCDNLDLCWLRSGKDIRLNIKIVQGNGKISSTFVPSYHLSIFEDEQYDKYNM